MNITSRDANGLPLRNADVIGVQRRLRQRLLDDPRSLPWRPARDLAALLLLYVDDPTQCWRIGVEHLRVALGADRVDGGFIEPGQAEYTPAAESRRADSRVPSVASVRVNMRDPSVTRVWAQRTAQTYGNVASDTRIGQDLRDQLLSIGTGSKMALGLWDGAQPMGVLCADWLDCREQWEHDLTAQALILTQDVLGPVLAAARQLMAGMTGGLSERVQAVSWADLTPAELKVARLAALGMSYKEIARQLGRSFSTVDHHLRSLRIKLGARSTARLIGALAAHPHVRDE